MTLREPLSLCPPISKFPTRARDSQAPPGEGSSNRTGGFALRIPAFDRLPSASIRCDDNVMCRMLIQAQSNIICSVFRSAFSLRSIKLITVLGFGSGRAKRGEMGEEEGSKQGLMAF